MSFIIQSPNITVILNDINMATLGWELSRICVCVYKSATILIQLMGEVNNIAYYIKCSAIYQSGEVYRKRENGVV